MTTLGGVLRLARASLALSPLADGLAGAAVALAAGATMDARAFGAALVASLFLYLFGMAQNDLADREKDRRSRPERPLPSGQVSLAAARVVVASAALVAAAAAACSTPAVRWLAGSLLVCISLYNLAPVHLGAFGPVLLGAIRAQNLALGAAALGAPEAAAPAALCYFLYIGAVSLLARMEDEEVPIAPRRGAALLRFAACAGFAAAAASAWAGPRSLAWLCAGLAVALFLGARLARSARALCSTPTPGRGDVGRAVGAGLSAVFLFDAAVAFAAGRPAFGAIALALFPLARLLVRRFPPT